MAENFLAVLWHQWASQYHGKAELRATQNYYCVKYVLIFCLIFPDAGVNLEKQEEILVRDAQSLHCSDSRSTTTESRFFTVFWF